MDNKGLHNLVLNSDSNIFLLRVEFTISQRNIMYVDIIECSQKYLRKMFCKTFCLKSLNSNMYIAQEFCKWRNFQSFLQVIELDLL